MPHVSLTQPLSRLLQPSFVLDYLGVVGTQGAGNGLQMQCWMDGIDAAISEGGDLQTFCNQYERTFDVSVKMTDELYTLLKPLENQQVTFATLRDATVPVSANNLEHSGIVEVPSIPIAVSGSVRSVNSITLTFTLVGDLTTVNTPGAAVTTHPV